MLALMICASAGGAWAQSSTEATLEQAARAAAAQKATSAEASSEPAVIEAVEVTGSRLQNGDVTADVQVITAEEIRARGVTSVEELIRTLPQNVANVGALTNDRAKGPLKNRTAPVSRLGALGVSAANLGGMGAGNTLVLINGRRANDYPFPYNGRSNFQNFNNIPAGAVERIDKAGFRAIACGGDCGAKAGEASAADE